MKDEPRTDESARLPAWKPRDPDFAPKVRTSFAGQRVMERLGAELVIVEPGRVAIEMPYHLDWTQQHEFLHAGITTAIADSAGGYAAFSLMPAGASVLTVEFKVNLVAPARGERFRGEGRVVKAGRRLFVCEISTTALRGAEETVCLVGSQTVMCLPGRADGPSGGAVQGSDA